VTDHCPLAPADAVSSKMAGCFDVGKLNTSFPISLLHIKVLTRLVICQSRGVVTSQYAVGINRNDASSTYMVGEAVAYVQGSGLKVIATVVLRFTNSPAARGLSSGGRFL